MDIFAHSLWTGAIFYKKYHDDKKNLWLSILFGILPDLVSFSPVFIYLILANEDFFSFINSGSWLSSYAENSYNYTHSAVFFFLAVVLVALLRKGKIYWPMFGWLVHICIDIFTHKGFYETPFLFPLFGYKFGHGISWGHPVFMVINYACLALVYLFIFWVARKRNKVM